MRAPCFLTMIAALLPLLALETHARPPRRPHAPPGPAQQAPPPQGGARQPEEKTPSQENPPDGGDHALPRVGLYPASGESLHETPVSRLFPGNVSAETRVTNPVEGSPEAIQRGMSYFSQFNCVGCHAPNGGGGMGPALSNRFFVYGDDPANIYLSIYQGRPNGMPAWGAMLSENLIWDLVAYLQSISKEPITGWGETASHDAWTIEQHPAEFSQTTTPWSQTQRFSFGRSPSGRR